MARTLPLLSVALLLGACSDYNLEGEKDQQPAGEEEEEQEQEEPGEDPDIKVTPDALDFGGLPRDCPASPQSVLITNEGLGTLVVSEIAVDGSGNSAFSHDWDGTELTLEYGESAQVEVAFTPTAWVDYAVAFEVTSNDPDEGLVQVPTEGFGAEDTTYEQSFVQDYHSDVDVLWVVDNSGSMDEELQQVAQNFATFINEFVLLDLTFHIGVVTTDMDDPDQSGKFRGAFVTHESADPVAEFLAQVDQGATGSGSERGFDAVTAALSAPLSENENAGFLREDAALAVVLLSDEDDDSSMGAAQFSTWLEGLKPDAELVTFSAICGDRLWGCQEFDVFGNTLSASGGDQYIDSTDLTGGFWASICTSDYEEVLQHISLTAAGMTVEFALDHEPSALSQVAVTVSGVEIANDSTNGWTYDADSNSVVFHGDGIPGPGETVTVSYPIAGECPG